MKMLPDGLNGSNSLQIYRKVAQAHRFLAELKGRASSLPKQSILIDTLSIQEAKDSSAIENIITTHDELYRSSPEQNEFTSIAAKEVLSYVNAMKVGHQNLRRTGLITLQNIHAVQEEVKGDQAGFRKLPGTVLRNESNGEIVYTPPQHPDEIIALMENLLIFTNDEKFFDADPLVKMAIIHHRFESIHPYYDGNGRTGRILNILYLMKEDLLDLPILYMSRFINQNRQEYYRLLQATRDTGDWEPWVLFMLESIIETSKQTIIVVGEIKELMLAYKKKLRSELPGIYSQDLLNNVFTHPYTKIEFVMKDLHVSRLTATSYLEKMCNIDLLRKTKVGRTNFYVNDGLVKALV